jgi:predicted ATPase
MMAIRIVQYLCPDRHCILAAAYDDRLNNGDEVQKQMQEFMNQNVFNKLCAICASDKLRFEDAPTKFATMDEAKPVLDELERLNMKTRVQLSILRSAASLN